MARVSPAKRARAPVWTGRSPFGGCRANRPRPARSRRDCREGSSFPRAAGRAGTGWTWRNATMRKLIGATMVCLLGGLLVGTPVEAGHGAPSHAVSLNRPATADERREAHRPRPRSHEGRAADARERALAQRPHRARCATAATAPRSTAPSRTSSSAPAPATAPARPGPSRARVLTDACGTQPRKANGTYWACTFVDDFTGTTLDRTKWVPQTIFATGDALSGYACYDDDPSVVSVGGGTLNLSVRKNATALPCANGLPDTPYRAGMVSTYHLFSQQYGRFEARFKTTATTAPGLQESWWLWPDDRDPLAPARVAAERRDRHRGDLLGPPRPRHPVPALRRRTTTAARSRARTRRGAAPLPAVSSTPTRWSGPLRGSRCSSTASSCLVNTSGDSAFRKHYILNLTQALGTGTDARHRGDQGPGGHERRLRQGLEVAPLHNGARGESAGPLVLGIETSCDETGVGIVRGQHPARRRGGQQRRGARPLRRRRTRGGQPGAPGGDGAHHRAGLRDRGCAAARPRRDRGDQRSGPRRGAAGRRRRGQGARAGARQAAVRRQPPRLARGRRPARARAAARPVPGAAGERWPLQPAARRGRDDHRRAAGRHHRRRGGGGVRQGGAAARAAVPRRSAHRPGRGVRAARSRSTSRAGSPAGATWSGTGSTSRSPGSRPRSPAGSRRGSGTASRSRSRTSRRRSRRPSATCWSARRSTPRPRRAWRTCSSAAGWRPTHGCARWRRSAPRRSAYACGCRGPACAPTTAPWSPRSARRWSPAGVRRPRSTCRPTAASRSPRVLV